MSSSGSRLICSEKLKPVVNKSAPWSMDQFQRLFNSVRVPGLGKDKLECYFKSG